MIRKFTHTIHVPGTLGADLAVYWTVPSPCTLVHVSAVGSNSAAGGLSIGTSADADGYLTKCSIGVSNTPVEKAFTDFDGALLTNPGHEPPHVSDGDVLAVALDYDYNGGGSASASADVTIVLTFVEG
ncbi:MAG: hypothetical protein JXA09_03985 [Anaerolineae bacterium]|nr:hypothetical protein [Anaerolineae bacterium]